MKLLGWTEVPAHVEAMTDQQAAIRCVVENENRADTNIIEKALAYRSLMGPPANLTQVEVAKEVGVSQGTVSRTTALLEEPQEIQELLATEQLSDSCVVALMPIRDSKKRISMAKKAAAEGWSVKEIKKRVKRNSGKRRKEEAESEAVSRAPFGDYSGFRLKLVGEEIFLSGRTFKLHTDNPHSFAADLEHALNSFLFHDMPGATGIPTAEDINRAEQQLGEEFKKAFGSNAELLSNLARAFGPPGKEAGPSNLGDTPDLLEEPKK
jgi:ParB-like chromosome segregation protein Spo0J